MSIWHPIPLMELIKPLPKVVKCYARFCFFQWNLFLPGFKHFISLRIHSFSSKTFATFLEVSYPSGGYSLEKSNKGHRSTTYTDYWTTANLRLLPFQVLSIRNNQDIGSSSLLKSTMRFQVKIEVGSNCAISNCMDSGTINGFLWKTLVSHCKITDSHPMD